MRIFGKLGLRYETTQEPLKKVLTQVAAMLRDHPRVETATAWIRLAKLAEGSMELEMQAYVLTRDYDDYAAVREDLLLRIMDIVEACGTALSSPSQTVFLAREPKAPRLKSESDDKV
jgi:MscS family membrane protein